MENIRIEDAMKLLSLRFDEQVNREQRERTRLDNQISALTEQYQRCIQQSIETHDVTEDKLLEITQKIQTLENEYARHFTHLDGNLVDIRTQFMNLQKNQTNHQSKQDKKIEQMSKRLDQLEHKPRKTLSQRFTGLSFFPSNRYERKSSQAKSAALDIL